MASAKNLEAKKKTVEEISNKIKDSTSVVIFSYQGLSVADMTNLRNKLREDGSELKVYKNTLAKKAFEDVKIDNADVWEGPNAILFGKTLLEPMKVIYNASKDNKNIVIRAGVADGKPISADEVKAYAEIPSREALLTMFAAGIMQHVKNFAIGLDLYAKKLEENK